MTDWIVFYDDGATFSSVDGGPEDAPRVGVQVIALRDPDNGRRLLWHQDTYCWEDGTWVPHDREQLERYRLTTKWPIWLAGYCRSNDVFWPIYRAALTDPRLPPKTGAASREQGSHNEWGRYGNERG